LGIGKVPTEFCWRYLKERDDLEGISVDGRTILICAFKNSDEGMDLVDVSEDSDRFRALVIVVMNLFLQWRHLPPPSGPKSPRCRGFTITLRRTTVGTTPLDE